MDNLDVKKLSIFDIEQLGEEYDFITCTGVLHHLPDPVAGCRKLKSVLSKDGVASLMLYGSTLRVGVYMLQDAFRTLGLKQSDEDVAFMKESLSVLPEFHALRAYAQAVDDWDFDGGLVDTFLNPQDVAYDVKEIMEFIEQSGLKFHSWNDNSDYEISNYLAEDAPLFARLSKLQKLDQWHFIDKFRQLRGTHRFLVCHEEKNNHTIEVGDARLDTLVPHLRPPMKVLEKAGPANNNTARIDRGGYTFLSPKEVSLFIEAIDGRTTIGKICVNLAARYKRPVEEVRSAAVSVFKDLYDKSHIMLQKIL